MLKRNSVACCSRVASPCRQRLRDPDPILIRATTPNVAREVRVALSHASNLRR